MGFPGWRFVRKEGTDEPTIKVHAGAGLVRTPRSGIIVTQRDIVSLSADAWARLSFRHCRLS
jgi:hypothetical protein